MDKSRRDLLRVGQLQISGLGNTVFNFSCSLRSVRSFLVLLEFCKLFINELLVLFVRFSKTVFDIVLSIALAWDRRVKLKLHMQSSANVPTCIARNVS
jgi:hypothetical protein